MEQIYLKKKIASKIYLEMMPRIAFYGDSETLSHKVYDLLSIDRSIQSLSNFLYEELGDKIENKQKSQILAQILLDHINQWEIN